MGTGAATGPVACAPHKAPQLGRGGARPSGRTRGWPVGGQRGAGGRNLRSSGQAAPPRTAGAPLARPTWRRGARAATSLSCVPDPPSPGPLGCLWPPQASAVLPTLVLQSVTLGSARKLPGTRGTGGEKASRAASGVRVRASGVRARAGPTGKRRGWGEGRGGDRRGAAAAHRRGVLPSAEGARSPGGPPARRCQWPSGTAPAARRSRPPSADTCWPSCGGESGELGGPLAGALGGLGGRSRGAPGYLLDSSPL